MTGTEDEPEQGRSGFVAVLGAPNAGKSTLVNRMVGEKVAIVTPKVQTTRTRVLGIATHGSAQIVLVDTPGIFLPRRRLDRAMVAAAWSGAGDADRIIVVVDASRRSAEEESLPIIERLQAEDRKAVLAINKVDAAPREKLLGLADRMNASGVFTDIFMISALTGDGVHDLIEFIASSLPEGPWLFPADQVSDMPMRLLAAEITREKLFTRLRQELPYALTVETESWEERPDGRIVIGQVIYVERDSQKAIVLGERGRMIKAVGTEARAELMDILEAPVHLDLFVKVRGKWAEDPERYREWGLDWNA